MKKILFLSVIVLGLTISNAKEGKMKTILLEQGEAQAIYEAMNDFNNSQKSKEISQIGVIVSSYKDKIEVSISEHNEEAGRGGGGKVFVYDISKKGNKIEDIKEFLQK